MKRLAIMTCAAAAGISLLVTGCSTLDQIVGKDNWQEWTPQQTSLQISQSGSVTETIIESLDKSYYSADELQDMIARSVKEYNSEHGENSITVPGYKAENGRIDLVLVYRTADDYTSYNQVEYAQGSMLDVQMKGITFPDTFREVSGSRLSDKAVSSEEALSHKEYSIAVTNEDHVVQVPGQIRYLSDNAQLVNSHVAAPSAESSQTEKEEQQGLVLPSNAVYYETESEGEDPDLSPVQPDKLYIIYEEDPEQET